jgi:hypothetical protein
MVERILNGVVPISEFGITGMTSAMEVDYESAKSNLLPQTTIRRHASGCV